MPRSRGTDLLVFLAVVSTGLLGFAVARTGGQARVDFDEITVHRIRVVEPDGTLRMVIANYDGLPRDSRGNRQGNNQRPGAGGLSSTTMRGRERRACRGVESPSERRRAEERGARVERLRAAAETAPGVRSASVSAVRVLAGASTGWSSGLIGVGDEEISERQPAVWLNATTPGWFETMRMSLRSGRDFQGDRLGSAPVVMVNETFVRRFLPGMPALGQYVRMGRDTATRYEIVGVVADAIHTTPREGMVATMYFPVAQRPPQTFWPTVLVTINAAPRLRAAVEREIAAAFTQADPTVAFTFGTFDQLVEATVTQERLLAMLSAFFGGLALLLAAVGLYGVVAHAVRARQVEIGVRMALGAEPSNIVRLVFQRVGAMIAAGLALGLAGSLWAVRFVEMLLFHIDARDPVTFGGAAIVLLAVGGVAAWMPARRAARLDPMIVLREG